MQRNECENHFIQANTLLYPMPMIISTRQFNFYRTCCTHLVDQNKKRKRNKKKKKKKKESTKLAAVERIPNPRCNCNVF